MTEEEKQILLKELFARVPYGVKLRYIPEKEDDFDKEKDFSIKAIDIYGNIIPNALNFRLNYCLENTKPYLRSMSSMTEEEMEDLEKYLGKKYDFSFTETESFIYIDWLNTNHFDYRGLIEKGLALEAKEGMYKTK